MEKISGTLLSVRQASELLAISPQQIRNLCRSGKLQSERIGNSWVIDKGSLELFFDNTCTGVAEDRIGYFRFKQGSDKPMVLSFFSGAMGLDIGLENAGFETVFASEIDNACRKTILANNPDIALVGDIRDYDAGMIRSLAGISEAYDIDLIAGGPPCQAFSTAGKRKGFEDERGNVFLKFIELILELNPKYAVIENVRGLLSAPLKHRPHNERGSGHPPLSEEELPGGAIKYIINLLEEGGYGVSLNLYNSANFGTPQKRERVIMICARSGETPPYLEPTHSQNGEFGLPKWRTFSDALENESFEKHDFVKFPDKRLKYYKLIPEGGNWRSLSEDLQKEALGASYYAGGGKTGFLRRLAWHKPSPTLVTHPAMPATDLAHPEEDRPLSVQEYRCIQQFPKHWRIEGSMLEKYRQLGNAVPVGLGEAVGKHVMKLLKGEHIKDFQGFSFSRYRNTSYQDVMA